MKNSYLQLLIDKRNQRWFQILTRLERSSHLSASKLAHSLSISSRTASSDLKEIKDYFDKSIVLTASTQGYSLTIDDKATYTDLKKRLLENEPLLTILSGIFFGKTLSIFDWSDQLFVADSTLTAYLKKLDPVLELYQLKMGYPLLTLEGKEIDIRNFFFSLFYEEGIIPHYIFPPILINDIIRDIFTEEFSHVHFDIPHYKFSYLVFITYQRIISNNILEIDDVVIEMMQKSDLSIVMNQLNHSFEKYTSLHLGSADLVYLMLMISDSISYSEELDSATTSQKIPDSSLLQLTIALCKELNIPDDNQARQLIHSFFQLQYLKNKASFTCLFLPPALLNHNKTHYKSQLLQLKKFLKKHSALFPLDNSTEFEQTLLIFNRRLRYRLNPRIRNIAFLFEGPTELTLLLEEITRMYIPPIHSIHFFYVYTSLEDELAKRSIDLVITNFNEYIFELPDNMDYLLFSHIPTPNDWNTLINIIDPRLIANYKIYSDRNDKG